jgi:2',3'-cyclic-nucleotide 2'-phosphodiesterase (5'-nucleotidase family)
VAEIIDRGPIRLGQLAGMLPFENLVVLVEVSEIDLWDVLEHSVARLGNPGDAGIAGRFLQVSHLRFDVDCDRPAATADQVGERVTAITWIDEAQDGSTEEHVLDRGARNDPSRGACDDGGGNPAPCLIGIAVNDFLEGGGDGYEWLRTKIGIAEERADFVAVANYIANQPNQAVSPAIEGRINLDASCTRRLE